MMSTFFRLIIVLATLLSVSACSSGFTKQVKKQQSYVGEVVPLHNVLGNRVLFSSTFQKASGEPLKGTYSNDFNVIFSDALFQSGIRAVNVPGYQYGSSNPQILFQFQEMGTNPIVDISSFSAKNMMVAAIPLYGLVSDREYQLKVNYVLNVSVYKQGMAVFQRSFKVTKSVSNQENRLDFSASASNQEKLLRLFEQSLQEVIQTTMFEVSRLRY